MATAAQLSSEQLIAFNDELAALLRAGVPLERGLRALGREERGRLGAFATEMSARLERGESLDQLITQHDPIFPPLYRAVLAAGLRSGRLAGALEGLAKATTGALEMRRRMTAALAYPLLVAAVAYGLFVLSIDQLVPPIADAYDVFRIPPPPGFDVLLYLGETWRHWAPWPPVLLAVWILWQLFPPAQASTPRSWFRPLATLYRYGRWTAFCNTLAVLVEHDVPLPEAAQLAAQASGDRQLAAASTTFAERAARGEREALSVFPPMLAFLLSTARGQDDIVHALRRLAGDYERRMQRGIQWLTLYLPAVLTIVIGGGATLTQLLCYLAPWFYLLNHVVETP